MDFIKSKLGLDILRTNVRNLSLFSDHERPLKTEILENVENNIRR